MLTARNVPSSFGAGVVLAPATRVRSGWIYCGALILAVLIWLVFTKAFWVGYVGSDDHFYARYAYLFHRRPINWWECRLPAVLAIRAAFLLFGPGELAAALPTLIVSFAATAAIAWCVNWPRVLEWKTTSTVLLAITLPLDVTFRSVPGATFLAGCLLIIGSVSILKRRRYLDVAGAIFFAAAIATHELSCFYVAIFLGVAVVFDRRQFLRPLVLSIVFAFAALAAQAAYYAILYGDPFLRFRLALSESAGQSGMFDPETHMGGLRFLLWPLETMVFSKPFSGDLLLLFILGAVAWKKLLVDQRILLVSGFLTWAYLGYGTKVPWAYRPLARMNHFYGPLSLSIAVILPVCIGHWFRHNAKSRRIAGMVVAGIVLSHLACLAAGGRWGQSAKVSGSLLNYALSHPSSTFLTDVGTMNEMYVQNGFRLPPNVVCKNGRSVENDLLVNKEPPENKPAHGWRFPDSVIDGILLNLDQGESDPDPDFAAFVAGHPGARERIVPIRYKPLFAPFQHLLRDRAFTIASNGAERIELH